MRDNGGLALKAIGKLVFQPPAMSHMDLNYLTWREPFETRFFNRDMAVIMHASVGNPHVIRAVAINFKVTPKCAKQHAVTRNYQLGFL